jgi:hypothetical protein
MGLSIRLLVSPSVQGRGIPGVEISHSLLLAARKKERKKKNQDLVLREGTTTFTVGSILCPLTLECIRLLSPHKRTLCVVDAATIQELLSTINAASE